MNFQAYLEDAWRITKAEPLILIGGGFLYQVLFYLTFGWVAVVAGPLLGGYLHLIILYLREGKPPVFNDLFSGFKRFGVLFPYFLVLLITLIGFALLVIPGIIFLTWWIYVLPLMVDRNMTFSDAMRLSMKQVNETGFFMHLAFILLVTVVPSWLLIIVSGIAPFLMILSVLLPPLQFGCLASLYLHQFGTEEPPGGSAEQSDEAAAPGAAAGPETGNTAKEAAGTDSETFAAGDEEQEPGNAVLLPEPGAGDSDKKPAQD